MNINEIIQSALQHYHSGNFHQAQHFFEIALELRPNDADILFLLGIITRQKGHIDEAIGFFKKTIEHNSYKLESYCNLGNCYLQKGHPDEAISCYRGALQCDPNVAEVYSNLGCAFDKKGQFNEGLSYHHKAIELDKDYAQAHLNLAFCLIALGDLKRGWQEFQWRWKTEEGLNFLRQLHQPLWTGFNIAGRTILLLDGRLGSVGYGDTIQFIRYAPFIAERGAKVIFACKKELISLLKNVGGISQIIELEEQQLPYFDAHCYILDLPFLFDVSIDNIPTKVPYISVDPILVRTWGEKLHKHKDKLKVGLVWAAGGSERSCSLEALSPLGQIGRGVVFYSLQKGEAAKQAKNPPKGMQFIDLTEDIHDFGDTAALMENLDLVICVDTGVTHLTGALGKPVWTLLPFVSPWRWMLNRDDSPWYPTMRLFRQPSPGDWESVIAKVKGELLRLFEKNKFTLSSSVLT